MTSDQIKAELNGIAYSLGPFTHVVAKQLLDNSDFYLWSGSSKRNAADYSGNKHHYGDGGLAQHTYEVVKLCLNNAEMFPQYNIDKTELFLAALFHDAGKMWDYERIYERTTNVVHWVGTEHKRNIHHISRSGIAWHDAITKLGSGIHELVFQTKYHDPVLHAILAHHGTRDWGSPVAPKSRVAWLVHLCDGISARMYDADTLDVVRDRK